MRSGQWEAQQRYWTGVCPQTPKTTGTSSPNSFVACFRLLILWAILCNQRLELHSNALAES